MKLFPMLLLLLLVSCTSLRDARTVQNPGATRVWFVHGDEIVLCESDREAPKQACRRVW